VPALIPFLVRVSSKPFTIRRPPLAVGVEALCDTKTRSVTLLGEDLAADEDPDPDPPPQETRMRLVITRTPCSRTNFFKTSGS
jgi:hypothetical protein